MAETKIFDPIHGFIAISPLMKRILATPAMHRLRDLKQLGATSYVFPGATHTRLSHSIGVSYLAGKMMTSLRVNQPELMITDRDVELTRIAALVHDLGHGPYSHLYDDRVIESDEPKHEERGCKMFREMVRRHGLTKTLSRRGEDGELINQALAVRLAALFSFFLSPEYGELREALVGRESDAPPEPSPPSPPPSPSSNPV